MLCPACGRSLSPVKAGDISVDVCVKGCGGMWFDQLELKRLDEPHEAEGEMLLEIEVDSRGVADDKQRRRCPTCGETIMMRFFYSPRRKVRVDHCPNCAGHWLDAGELRMIRGLYPSQAERTAHLNEIIDELFGEELAAVEERRVKAQQSMSVTRKIFQFLMPGFI